MTPDDALARLACRLRRDQPPVVYCEGSLAERCRDELRYPGDVATAWRRVRAAAQEAACAKRCVLMQRRRGDVLEYVAYGLEE